jgi:hypothetical protein
MKRIENFHKKRKRMWLLKKGESFIPRERIPEAKSEEMRDGRRPCEIVRHRQENPDDGMTHGNLGWGI